uniref:Thiamine biosynthesis protein ThiI n=1 Tax=uncultured prokaryote TaxID=198431 RepID=H5SKM9_9ZZZZ|nr:thiamine biosynthesis protein ThiI [uncultured prokaryote]
MERVVLVRYGEIGLKRANRAAFVAQLARNLRDRLPGVRVENRFDHLVLRGAHAPWVLERLQRTFGVASTSPALEVAPELDAMEAAAQVLVAELAPRPGTTFKVETHRRDKTFPLTSPEVDRELGRRLLARFPELVARMKDPEVHVHLDIRDRAYVYTQVLPGPGGLPVGTGGRAVALLSGGIDSPVAIWMVAKRGVQATPLHFHAPPFTSERSKEKVVRLVEVLSEWCGPMDLWVVPFAHVQRAIRERVPEPLWTVTMRRTMMRVAERVAQQVGASALVTGESLGQVASQTLEALAAIGAATQLLVLRPLVGMDKLEITGLAQRIGTYEVSVLPYEDCCTLFVPRHPRTRPSLREAEEAEASLDVPALVEEALAGVEVISPAAPAPASA